MRYWDSSQEKSRYRGFKWQEKVGLGNKEETIIMRHDEFTGELNGPLD